MQTHLDNSNLITLYHLTSTKVKVRSLEPLFLVRIIKSRAILRRPRYFDLPLRRIPIQTLWALKGRHRPAKAKARHHRSRPRAAYKSSACSTAHPTLATTRSTTIPKTKILGQE